MGLEETLAKLESKREQPSIIRAAVKHYIRPITTGILTACATSFLTDDLATTIHTGMATGTAHAAINETFRQGHSFLNSWKNRLAYFFAGIKTLTWLPFGGEPTFVITYPTTCAVLGTADALTYYKPTTQAAKAITHYAPPLILTYAAARFGTDAYQFEYGYEYFPIKTFLLNIQTTIQSTALPYLAFLTAAKLLDTPTYQRITTSTRYLANRLLRRHDKARQAVNEQLQRTTDANERRILTIRKSKLSLEEGKLDKALLEAQQALQIQNNKKDDISASHDNDTLSTISKQNPPSSCQEPFWEKMAFSLKIPVHHLIQFIANIIAHHPSKTLHREDAYPLATTHALNGNYDLALHIMKKQEQLLQDQTPTSLFTALLHQHAGSPKTQAAYAYTAALIAARNPELLTTAGTSTRAHIIPPTTHSFLANNFVFYFGTEEELTKQEKTRQNISAILPPNAKTPQLMCKPTQLKNNSFSAYSHENARLLATSKNLQDYHKAARILGIIHARHPQTQPPRDYHATLEERVLALPNPLPALIIPNWHVLWHYIGNDYAYDRDSHGKNYAIANDATIIVLDFKPRQPNHRVIDLAKLINHTPLLSQRYNDQHDIITSYAKESHTKPPTISLQCAAPLIAINSLYFELVQHNEPGFCSTYLTNAEHALTHLFTNHNEEYLRFEHEFNNLKQALTLARNITNFTSACRPTAKFCQTF